MIAKLTGERTITLTAEDKKEEEALIRFGKHVNTLLEKKTSLTVVIPEKEKEGDQ